MDTLVYILGVLITMPIIYRALYKFYTVDYDSWGTGDRVFTSLISTGAALMWFFTLPALILGYLLFKTRVVNLFKLLEK